MKLNIQKLQQGNILRYKEPASPLKFGQSDQKPLPFNKERDWDSRKRLATGGLGEDIFSMFSPAQDIVDMIGIPKGFSDGLVPGLINTAGVGLGLFGLDMAKPVLKSVAKNLPSWGSHTAVGQRVSYQPEVKLEPKPVIPKTEDELLNYRLEKIRELPPIQRPRSYYEDIYTGRLQGYEVPKRLSKKDNAEIDSRIKSDQLNWLADKIRRP